MRLASSSFWRGKRVLVTGHTGFKGGWLSVWLQLLGARVHGYALPAPSEPSLFALARVAEGMDSVLGDIRDRDRVEAVLAAARPEIVFHLAAQPIVRLSYERPHDTFTTNILGTLNLLEAVRHLGGIRVLVVITSDKCYENREWIWGYRESEPLGGRDPYSSSKACAELVVAAYRESFFSGEEELAPATAIATARAGNVIGGGDWARDRLVPDIIRAISAGQTVLVRSPQAIRPWQHVLEPLGGYLLLAEQLWHDGPRFAGGWNFGPEASDARPVAWMVERIASRWGGGVRFEVQPVRYPHEATLLRLDCSKASTLLGWAPRLRLATALDWLVEWYRGALDGRDARKLTEEQVTRYASLRTRR